MVLEEILNEHKEDVLEIIDDLETELLEAGGNHVVDHPVILDPLFL